MAAESTMNSRRTDGILRINAEFSEKKKRNCCGDRNRVDRNPRRDELRRWRVTRLAVPTTG